MNDRLKRRSPLAGWIGCVIVLGSCVITATPAPIIAQETDMSWKSVHLDIVPTPKQCLATGREFRLGRESKITIVTGRDTPILSTARQTVVGFLNRKGFSQIELAQGDNWPDADLTILLGGPEVNPLSARVVAEHAQLRATDKLMPQGYSIRISEIAKQPQRIVAAILGADDAGTLYGVYTLLKTIRFSPEGILIRELQINDEPALHVRGLSPQWSWYIGERAPYGAALWGLDRWKQAIDFMAEYRFNMLALCTYGKFPFPLDRYRSRCAVDLPFDLWNPAQRLHTIRWTHPAFKDDFLGALVDYAHAHGIRVLIYSCLNLQDEISSHQWTNEEEIKSYCDIQQHLLKRYGIDGFIFESGEFHVTHPDDLKQFGDDEWTRLKADVSLTRRYTEAIRAVKPDAVIGLVDHYLFKNWDERKVPQRTGLERWKAELPPETLVAYVHARDTYDVFPPERIWTYVFGPKGGLKPAIQLHLADFCNVPREKKSAGAYFVTYDWSPHEPSYLCFAESAWGDHGGSDDKAFLLHSSEGGVGGDISGRVWNSIEREFYGDGADFGEGLRTAAQGTFKGMWDPVAVLRKSIFERLVPALDKADSHTAEKLLAEVGEQQAWTEKGLALMSAQRGRALSQMVSEYPIHEHLEKAILLTQVQLAWVRFVRTCHESVVKLAQHPEDEDACTRTIDDLRAESKSAHAKIRASLSNAYFSYPHDKLGKFEFLAGPAALLEDILRLRIRFSLAANAKGERLRLHNVSREAQVSADSNYAPGYYDPEFAVDGKMGTPSQGIWVSAETDPPHRLELRFGRPPMVRGIVIDWVRGDRNDWVPQEFAVQVCTDKQWRTILDVRDNKDTVAVAMLDPPAPVEQMRIVITRGPQSRPRLGAINEVQVLAIKEQRSAP